MIFKALDKRNIAHEQVIFCSDSSVGLKAIIAIHSTSLGPALGGCRMYNYKTEEEALNDVLDLSEAMSYKAAVAGLPYGGGKSVILADPDKQKTPELLQSFGRHIESLKGRYVAAKDMGITIKDLDEVAKESSYIVGRSKQKGGVGDPSRWTALGVYYGLKMAVQWKLKKDTIKNLKIIVQGVGSVGTNLVEFLVNDGAEVLICDIKEESVKKVKEKFSQVQIIASENSLNIPCDIFAPCAMGSVITPVTVKKLNCSIVAGGANNPLSSLSIGQILKDKGILYIPDFALNSGGLIYVASHFSSKNSSNDLIKNRIKEIPQTIKKICELSVSENLSTAQIALNLGKEKVKNKKVFLSTKLS